MADYYHTVSISVQQELDYISSNDVRSKIKNDVTHSVTICHDEASAVSLSRALEHSSGNV